VLTWSRRNYPTELTCGLRVGDCAEAKPSEAAMQILSDPPGYLFI
jgi:hypothetical protein